MGESYTNVTEGSGKKQHSWQRTVGANNVEDSFVLLSEPPYASYSLTTNPVAVSTANSHLLQIMAGSSLKVRIRRIEIWQVTAITAGALFDLQLYRLTSAGTGGGAAGSSALDPSEAAAGATAQTLPSSKGTEGDLLARGYPYLIQTVGASESFTNPVLVWNFDQPRVPPLIIGAGTSNGIAIKNASSAAAGTVGIQVWFSETAW